jgi:ATP-dependent helicase/nuclease subunit A
MSANLQQLQATDPLQSAWVAANAGSGKTHVLVNRIARLLLSGSAPDRLLCLTFTKAAAAEMSTRLFGQLGTWTLLPDDKLRAALSEMCGEEATDELVTRARKLFAEALESPGGLRIQTIHAFCERLLKRFPLEANVSPQFSVLDDMATDDLLCNARDEVLRVVSRDDPALARAIGELTEFANDEQFDALIRHVISERSWIADFLEEHEAIGIDVAVRQALKLPDTLTEDGLVALMQQEMKPSDLVRLAGALRSGTKTDAERADLFQAAANAPSADTLQAVLDALLTKEGEPRAKLATKGALDQGPFVTELLSRYTVLAMDIASKRNGLFIAHNTTNLLRVARAIYVVYQRHKNARAALDYDDLINRTVGLFRSPGAYWVLYKLDGGIDHVLVDEAQDTSPNQWQIIKHIAEEFFAGAGAERRDQAIQRTIFAVGDIKQSIMSFQGARPIEFKLTREHIETQAQGANARFDRVELTQSFRTAPRILQLVDRVFANPVAADGVTLDDGELVHQARRQDMEGVVELWPLVQVPDAPERLAWDAPRDRITADHPAVLLAEKIAREIVGWLRSGTPVNDKAEKRLRRMTAGDVMILVRRRGTLANEIIRQLKRNSIPVAGADRLVLASHIAVMDLIAVGRFALLPRDDLSLATVLRGPLCGISEQTLFDLAYGRDKRSIWSVMCDAPSDPRWAEAWRFLDRVRSMADHLQPYEFYAAILGEMDGWKKMMARLGFDAADPIEEFMSAALDFGRMNTPSLEAFLHGIEQSDTEIKRDQDRGEGSVRVLTVHGSKGLEAPVVILPDTCTTPAHGRHDSELLQAGDAPLWKLKSKRDEPVRAAARLNGRNERMREYRRLLYVALTRARDRLIVCGHETGRNGMEPDCWYEHVSVAMQSLDAATITLADGEEILRLGSIPSETVAEEPVAATVRVLAPGLPSWVTTMAPQELLPEPLLATGRSRRVGVPAGEEVRDNIALDRGTVVHRILDAMAGLPEQRWAPVALDIARKSLEPTMVQGVVSEALRVRQDPAFEDLFGVNSRGEFPLRGELQWQGRMHKFDWRLDRVVIREADVLVLEFKTDRVVPKADSAIRPQYVRQLALYRRAVSSLFPEKPVSCGILWTVEPRLSVIPSKYLDDAEHALDPLVGGS